MLTALLETVDVDPLPQLDAAIARRAGDPFLNPREVGLLPADQRAERHPGAGADTCRHSLVTAAVALNDSLPERTWA